MKSDGEVSGAWTVGWRGRGQLDDHEAKEEGVKRRRWDQRSRGEGNGSGRVPAQGWPGVRESPEPGQEWDRRPAPLSPSPTPCPTSSPGQDLPSASAALRSIQHLTAGPRQRFVHLPGWASWSRSKSSVPRRGRAWPPATVWLWLAALDPRSPICASVSSLKKT